MKLQLPRWLASLFGSAPKPVQVTHREAGNAVALVLVHGFSGDTRKTWARLTDLLLAAPSIKQWDIYGVGFPSSLRVDVPLWAADPDIALIARELRTALALPPFARYQRIAIAAHSMGGLVVQRALLDDAKLTKRVSHLFLFGTPSNGLSSASLFAGLKRQIRDMGAGSSFITKLRSDWTKQHPVRPPFFFRAVAGDRDEFVSAATSIAPFADEFQAVVPGNHLEIVKPLDAEHASVQLLVSALGGDEYVRGAVDGAMLAIETGKFRDAVEVLLPRASSLDDAALSSLALALESLGRGAEALEVLEARHQSDARSNSADALGVLAGRIKRRWLSERNRGDLERARELFATGLVHAEHTGLPEQGYYHAINIAFLDLIASPASATVPQSVLEMAQRALDYCERSPETHWRYATEGEAWLMRGQPALSDAAYQRAISMTRSARELDSMYSQALRVAARVGGDAGVERIEALFRVAG